MERAEPNAPGDQAATAGRAGRAETAATAPWAAAPSRRAWAADAAAIAAIALCALVLHRDGLFGGPAFFERDTQIFYFPLAAWVSQTAERTTFSWCICALRKLPKAKTRAPPRAGNGSSRSVLRYR